MMNMWNSSFISHNRFFLHRNFMLIFAFNHRLNEKIQSVTWSNLFLNVYVIVRELIHHIYLFDTATNHIHNIKFKKNMLIKVRNANCVIIIIHCRNVYDSVLFVVYLQLNLAQLASCWLYISLFSLFLFLSSCEQIFQIPVHMRWNNWVNIIVLLMQWKNFSHLLPRDKIVSVSMLEIQMSNRNDIIVFEYIHKHIDSKNCAKRTTKKKKLEKKSHNRNLHMIKFFVKVCSGLEATTI